MPQGTPERISRLLAFALDPVHKLQRITAITQYVRVHIE